MTAGAPGSEPVRVGFPTRYGVVVVALLVFGALCLLVEAQSSSVVYWTGQPVVGTNDGGIVYYTVAGREHTLDAGGAGPAQPQPVTVYVDPEDSTHDRIAGPAKWLDAALVLTPFVAAAAVAAAGLRWRRRVRRALAVSASQPVRAVGPARP